MHPILRHRINLAEVVRMMKGQRERTFYQLFSPMVVEPAHPDPPIVVPVLGQIWPVDALYAQPPRVPTMTPLVTPVTMESGAFAPS